MIFEYWHQPDYNPQNLSLTHAVPDLFSLFNQLEEGQSFSLESPFQILPRSSYLVPPYFTPSLGLLSSGTTGSPKLIRHRWPDLKRLACERAHCFSWTWATPFRWNSFAGIQVAIQAWLTQGEVVFLTGRWKDIIHNLNSNKPDALCCTPTFLDLLSLNAPKLGWRPRQITVGGEPFRKHTRDRISALFTDWTKIRFTNVYASTELGVIAKSHRNDGFFDWSDVSKCWKEVELRDGILFLMSHDGEWKGTGDLVEEGNGFFRVLGRAGRTANVGGIKVDLTELESVVSDVTGVMSVSAWVEPSSVSGEVVALRFCPEPGMDESFVEAQFMEAVRSRLPKAAWPRWIELGDLTMGANAKKGD